MNTIPLKGGGNQNGPSIGRSLLVSEVPRRQKSKGGEIPQDYLHTVLPAGIFYDKIIISAEGVLLLYLPAPTDLGGDKPPAKFGRGVFCIYLG